MGSYYYLEDPKSESGFFPLSEEDFWKAFDAAANRYGLDVSEVTDEMIIKEYLGKIPKKKGKSNKKPRMINIRGK